MSPNTKKIIAISLTLNLITVGYFIGLAVSKIPVQKTIHKIERKAFFDKSNQLKHELAQILSADKFEEAAFSTKVKELDEHRSKLSNKISAHIIKLAEGLNKEERAELAKNLDSLIKEIPRREFKRRKRPGKAPVVHNHYYPPPRHRPPHGMPPPPGFRPPHLEGHGHFPEAEHRPENY